MKFEDFALALLGLGLCWLAYGPLLAFGTGSASLFEFIFKGVFQ